MGWEVREIMKKLFYSVLRYVPDLIRAENMIVGLVIHVPNDKYSHFFGLKNISRLKSFDDEYDSEYLKIVMESLLYEFSYGNGISEEFFGVNDEQNSNLETIINREDFLKIKTSSYSNEFIFDGVNSLSYEDEDLEQTKKDLYKTFLYYDSPKSDRITKQKATALLNRQVKTSGVKKTKADEVGAFRDVAFDLKANNIPIKVISFDYTKDKSLTGILKSTMFDIQTSIKKYNFEKVVIVTILGDEHSRELHEFIRLIDDMSHNLSTKIVVTDLSKLQEVL